MFHGDTYNKIRMALLINQSPDPIRTFPTVFSIIHQLMIEQQAVYFQAAEQKIYQTILHNAYSTTLLQWRFQPTTNNSVKVRIRPTISDTLGNNFRVTSQRNLVDLLRILGNFNRDKNKTVMFVISDYLDIQICTVYPEALLKNKNIIRKAIKNTSKQIKPAFEKLISLLKPFLQHQNIPVDSINPSYAAKAYMDKSYKLILLTKFNQYKHQYNLQSTRVNSAENAERQNHQKQLERQRVQALKKMKECLKLLGVPETFLNNSINCYLPSYLEWISHYGKEAMASQIKDPRNVYSVRILNQINLPLEKALEGSHCSIQMSNFKMIIKFSVNMEVNKIYEQNKKATEINKQVQLQLVKKTIKNQQTPQSRNSFQNEQEFILFIKDRTCKYVSTYYWDCDKKKQDIPIIMDYYPFNLRQMINSQVQMLGSREKLSIISKIISAVDWLASNYVCHRDIKPENIMMSQNRIPKLVDFGSCCPVSGVGTQHLKVKQTRLLATPGYYHRFTPNMAKIYQKKQYQQHLLFDAYSIGQIIMDVFDDGFPNLSPNLQGLIRYIVQRCKDEDPAERLTYQEMQYLFYNFVKCLQTLEQQNGNVRNVPLQELKGQVLR